MLQQPRASTVAEALHRVRARLEAGDVEGATQLIEYLLPADRADLFEDLEPVEQESLLPEFDVADAADLLEEMEDVEAAELAAALDPQELARILDEMEPDEAADILGDLDGDLRDAVLDRMADVERVQGLLTHSDETAGGRMTTRFLDLTLAMTVREALRAMREDEFVRTTALVVVDDVGRLAGTVDLFALLRAAPDTRLESLLEHHVLKTHVADDQETAARLMAHYDLPAVPVVDDGNRLVGIITADDLVDVLEEEATEDIQRIGGAQPLDRPYRGVGVFAAAWKRAGWLAILFVAATLSSSVMGLFEEQIQQAVVLAFFIPLLIDTGGNAGSQTIATVVRALAVGDIEFSDALRVVWREFRTALVLGVMLAVAAFGVAYLWSDSRVGISVAVSVLAIVVWANSLGALLPLLAVRVGLDPALVSGPLLTTLVDATGLLIYFSVASLVLGL